LRKIFNEAAFQAEKDRKSGKAYLLLALKGKRFDVLP
jgi:hypothetical protein